MGYTGKKKEICASSMSSVCCKLQHVHYFFMEDSKFYEHKFEHVYPDCEPSPVITNDKWIENLKDNDE